MTARGSLDALLVPVSEAVLALQDLLAAANGGADLMAQLGYKLPGGADANALFADVATKVTTLASASADVAQAYADGSSNDGSFLPKVFALAAAIVGAIQTAEQLAQRAQTVFAAAQDFLAHAPLDELPRRLVDRLIAVYVRKERPRIAAALDLLAITTDTFIDAGDYNPAYTQVRVEWERIPQWFTTPGQVLADAYRWGTASFDAELAIARLDTLLSLFGLMGLADPLTDPVDALAPPTPQLQIPLFSGTISTDDGLVGALLGMRVRRADATADPTDTGIAIVPFVEGAMGATLDLAPGWTLAARAGLDAEGLALTARPHSGVAIVAAPAAAAEVGVTLARDGSELGPIVLLGNEGATRLELGGLSLGVTGSISPQGADAGFELAVHDLALVVQASDGDGFLAKVLPPDPLRVAFDLTVGATAKRGLYFAGGAGLDYTFRLDAQLGPVFVSSIDVGAHFTATPDPSLVLSAAVTGGLSIGPVTAVVEKIGITATLAFGKPGNLGRANLALGFKPPTGVGLSIDSSAVRLGGFLSIDTERGRYVGAVSISLFKKLELDAVCIITTKLPDGTDGFSILVVIAIQFPVPIPLGYNFYLSGVGGALGVQRGFDVGKMRDGLRSGILDRVLFPHDVIGQIDRVVSDLDAVFPIAPGGFLVAPTITIQWSQPALLTAKLAIILSFDKSFKAAIAGVVRLQLPTPDKPVLQLQAAFLGTLDFDAGMLSFDASIYDSFFGVGDFKITVEGDIALRISWGKQKDFVLTVGGFHPSFQVPTYLDLPKLERVTLSVMRDNPRLVFTAYFALTTNTVQLGAHAELYVSAGPVEILGRLGFDALFQFSPFHFEIELEAMLSLKVGGIDLLAVAVDLALDGPTPWHAKGSATVKILFFEVHASFEARFGEALEQPRTTVALQPLLAAELAKPSAWTVVEAKDTSQLVSRRPLDSADIGVIESAGTLSVAQTVLPLGRTIEIYGQQVPSDVARFDVTSVTIAGAPAVQFSPATEAFAPAMFKNLSDRDKLAAPSYEQMPAGVTASVSAAGYSVGAHVLPRAYEYEVAISDRGHTATARAPGTAAELSSLLAGSSAAKSSGGRAQKVADQAGALGNYAVAEDGYSIVTPANAVVQRRLPRSEATALVDELTANGGVAFALVGGKVAVSAVAPGSAAAALVAGDVVVTIDGAAVTSLAAVRARASAQTGAAIAYSIKRGAGQLTVTVAGTRDRSSLLIVPDALAA